MAWNRRIDESIKIDYDAIPPQAAGANGKTSSWFSMAGYGRVRAEASFEATTATTAHLAIMQAKSEAGSDAKTLSEVTATSHATASEALHLSLEAAVGELDLANGYGYVQVKVTYGTSDYVSASLFRGDPAHRPPL